MALTQTNRQLTAVQTITQVITQTLKLNEIIENALDKLLTILELNALAVLLVNRDTNELTLGGQRNFKPAYLERITGSLPGQHLAETIAGAITNRTPRHVVGFAPVSASQPASPGRAPAGICSRASFPLLVNDDVLGVLHVESNKNYAIDDDELHSLELISQQLALAIGKAQLYADLQAAYKDLQQLDDMKSRFIMIASHELRTPLTILMGYAFLLQRQPAEMRREMVATIIEQAEVLKALVDRFLEVERLEQQDFWLDVVDVDLSQAVQTIVNTLKPLAADKTLTLTFTPLPAPHRVWIDPLKFEAILTNVLANAVQFTPAGGRITVTVAVTPPTFEVSVTDTGIGIPKAEHKRIFNKFYQVQKPLKRKHGGAGLGLSIAREMAHLCGGTITLQSTPGAGAVFTYRQPIRSADPRP
ncbi:MAG: ATP-binding protein [Anaerolineae bacterium]